MMLSTLIFSRFFHSNFIIQYLLFSTFLSYCTMLLYVMGSCKCRRGLSDPWNIRFYCSYCFFCILWLSCSVFPKETDDDDDDDLATTSIEQGTEIQHSGGALSYCLYTPVRRAGRRRLMRCLGRRRVMTAVTRRWLARPACSDEIALDTAMFSNHQPRRTLRPLPTTDPRSTSLSLSLSVSLSLASTRPLYRPVTPDTQLEWWKKTGELGRHSLWKIRCWPICWVTDDVVTEWNQLRRNHRRRRSALLPVLNHRHSGYTNHITKTF